jgi:hypothetical protein
MITLVKAGLTAVLVLVASATVVIPAFLGGYISRELVVATSPDGSAQAVCRGWYPHGMEYEMWLRRHGEWFGRRIGKVGAESMGRCAAVAWSADGRMIVASSTRGTLTMFDARAQGVIGWQNLDAIVYRGSAARPYSTSRMVTAVTFGATGLLRVRSCDRLWSRTRRPEDIVTCAAAESTDVVVVTLEPPRGMQLRWAVNRQN